jgi:hypothetical protein
LAFFAFVVVAAVFFADEPAFTGALLVWAPKDGSGLPTFLQLRRLFLYKEALSKAGLTAEP